MDFSSDTYVLPRLLYTAPPRRRRAPKGAITLADGRLYSGAQARDVGLVDELGGLAEATRVAWSRAGQTGEPRVSHVRLRGRPWWLDLLGLARLPDLSAPGGLLFLYRGPLLG